MNNFVGGIFLPILKAGSANILGFPSKLHIRERCFDENHNEGLLFHFIMVLLCNTVNIVATKSITAIAGHRQLK
jgi:hypothetical protein